jgi:cysteine synthase
MLQTGIIPSTKTIVEPSSGSTVISLSLASRALFGITDVHAYVSNKTEQGRLRTLQFFGVYGHVSIYLRQSCKELIQVHRHLYGGPAQPEIDDDRGIIAKVKRLAVNNEEIFCPSQYENNQVSIVLSRLSLARLIIRCFVEFCCAHPLDWSSNFEAVA